MAMLFCAFKTLTGFGLLFKANSTNVQNGKNRTFIFTILRHLRRANGDIEFTFI